MIQISHSLTYKKNSHSIKEIIMIIKSHNKFRIDITQIIERHIQIHRYVNRDILIFYYIMVFLCCIFSTFG